MRILSMILSIFIVSFLTISTGATEGMSLTDPAPVPPPSGMVPDNFILAGTHEQRSKNIFIADKKNRTLTVWTQDHDSAVLLDTFPMDIGKLQGDKSSAGDQKTPEGIYFFQERIEGSSLNFNLYGRRAFTLDYPNFFDQMAHKTGSGIWLHAVPDTTSLTRGSRGCVVVRNAIIDKLTQLINLKNTPLLILDKVTYVTPEKLLKRREELQSWLNQWQEAWQTKNIDKYMANYSENFSAMKMTREQWRSYKQSLNKKYRFIKVSLEAPFLITKQDEAVISFIQNYESDGLKDVGLKTLYVKNQTDGKFEIITEIWRPQRADVIAQKQDEKEN